MIHDINNTVLLGLDYFCAEGDSLRELSGEDFSALAVNEMLALGLISSRDDVLYTHSERVRKAYPAYFDTYSQIGELREFLDTIPNLYCVGRNGQHHNIDHSMCTAFEAVKCILSGSQDKSSIWNVNIEKNTTSQSDKIPQIK